MTELGFFKKFKVTSFEELAGNPDRSDSLLEFALNHFMIEQGLKSQAIKQVRSIA